MRLDAEIARTGDMSDAAISLRAKALRRALGMTQQAIADHLGVTVSAVKSWEAAAGNGVRAAHVGKLSDLADVRADFLIRGDVRETVIRRELWERVRAEMP